MNPAFAALRRALRLPRARCRTTASLEWIPLSDGVRLATRVVRPDGRDRAPALLVRTAGAAHAALHPPLLLARLLAEQGYAVAVQACRGRHASEGRFAPFESERRDGGEAVAWLAEQPWCDGNIALAGWGYAGYAAWAALAGSPLPIRALVVGFAAREPRAVLCPGGAFALSVALRFAVGLGEREEVPERRMDLARALAFRPVREADRVAHRRVDWYRAWVDAADDPEPWRRSAVPLPEVAPPALLVAGWNDPCLAAQLGDYEALRAAGTPAPELLVGPWPRRGPWGAEALRAALAFLDGHLRGAPGDRAPVRFFVGGAGRWQTASAWPPPAAREVALHLHGDGRLDPALPNADQPPDRFVYDSEDPVPTCDGDQREVEVRDDVLCYTSAPLDAALELAGGVRAELFASSNAPGTDFTAKLVDVRPDGRAIRLCDGIARCRSLEPDVAVRLEIDLGPAAHRLARGHRVRLEVSSSNFPRFDRHPDARIARQAVLHDAEHPSRVLLCASGPAGRADGPAASDRTLEVA